MKLYYSPLSPYSRKTLMAFGEKQITDVDREVVNLMDPVAKAEYTDKINKLGKVPMLVLDDGWMIPESSIIIEYIEGHYDTGTKLIPDDKDLARRARFSDRVGDLYVIDQAGTLFFGGMKPEGQRPTAQMDKARHTIDLSLQFMNETLGKTPFALGNELTLADLSSYAGLTLFAHTGGNVNDYPNVAAWMKRMSERPAIRAVDEETMAAAKAAGM